jgi:PKD repeat protein
MKNRINILNLFWGVIFTYSAAAQNWPTSNQKIAAGFSTCEVNEFENLHYGIDIPGTAGASNAVIYNTVPGWIYQVVQEHEYLTNTDLVSVTVYFAKANSSNQNTASPTGEIFVFGHVIQVSGQQLYSMLSSTSFQTTYNGWPNRHWCDAITPLCQITPHSDARTTHDHTHVMCYIDGITGSFIDPLTEFTNPVSAVPQLGALYFENCNNVATPFINSGPIYGSGIKILREIYQNQGITITPLNTCNQTSPLADQDAWHDAPNILPTSRINYKVSSPPHIKYQINNTNNQRVYPLNNIGVSNDYCELFIKNPSPYNYLNTNLFNIDHLFYNDKKVYSLNCTGNIPVAFNYVYDLTQIEHTDLSTSITGLLDQNKKINTTSFPDGKYYLKMMAEDLAGTPSSEPQIEFKIDNLKPYVKKVVVKAFSATGIARTIYNAEWQSSGTQLSLVPQSLGIGEGGNNRLVGAYNTSTDNHLQIEITFSEPMDNANVKLRSEDLDQTIYSDQNFTNVNSSTLIFTVDNSTLLDNSNSFLQDIVIRGKDLCNNDLLNYSEFNTSISANQIPFRDNNGNWITTSCIGVTGNSGDVLHHFAIFGCWINGHRISHRGLAGESRSSSTCFSAEFTADIINPTIDDPVTFNDESIGSPEDWYWDFGDGSSYHGQTANPNPPLHHFIAPGSYTIILTITNSSGDNDQIVKTSYINVSGSSTGGLSSNFTPSPASILQGNYITFHPIVTGSSGSVTYLWHFNGGSPSSSTDPVPTVYYSNAGTWDAYLTVTDATGSITAPSNAVTVNAYTSPVDIHCPIWPPMVYDGQETSLSVFAFGGVPPYSFDWVYTDNVTNQTNSDLNVGGVVLHTFTGTGHSYTVTVTVHDQLNQTNQCEINFTTQSASGTDGDFTSSTNQFPTIFFYPTVNNHCTQGTGYIEWNFGDQSPIASGLFDLPISHTYYQGGTYHVTMTIHDNCFGVSSITHDVSFVYAPNGFQADFSFIACDPTEEYSNPYLEGMAWGGNSSDQGGVIHSTGDPLWDPDAGSGTQYSQYWFSWSILGNACLTLDRPLDQATYLHPSTTCNGNGPNTDPHDNQPFSFTAIMLAHDYNTVNSKQVTNTAILYPQLLIDPPLEDVSICPGTSTQINATVWGGTGPGTYTYGWSSDPNGAINFGAGAGNYNPIVHFNSGFQSATIRLEVNDARHISPSACSVPLVKTFNIVEQYLEAHAGNDINVCLNSYATIGLPATGGSGHYNYTWSPASNLSCAHCVSPVFIPTQTGSFTYTIEVTDQSGCVSTDQIVINVNNNFPVLTTSEDQSSCPGLNINLSGSANGGGTGNYTYQWFESENSSTVLSSTTSVSVAPWQTTYYNFVVTDANGCATSQPVYVFVDQSRAPNVNAGTDRSSCPLHTAEYTTDLNSPAWSETPLHGSASGGIGTLTYEWTDCNANVIGQSLDIILHRTPQCSAFYLTAIDELGCKGRDEVNIQYNAGVWLFHNWVNLLHVYTWKNQPVQLNAPTASEMVGSGIPPYTYEWSPSLFLNASHTTNAIATPQWSMSYGLYVTDAVGCTIKGSWLLAVFDQVAPPVIESENEGCVGVPFCFQINPNVYVAYEAHHDDVLFPHGYSTSNANAWEPYTWELFDSWDPSQTHNSNLYCPCVPGYDQLVTNVTYTPSPSSTSQTISGYGGIYCATFDSPGPKTISFSINSYGSGSGNQWVSFPNTNPVISTKTINITDDWQIDPVPPEVWTIGPIFGNTNYYRIISDGWGNNNFDTGILLANPSPIVKARTLYAGDLGNTGVVTDVLNNNQLDLKATYEVVLYPLFTAIEGSTFTASVGNCYEVTYQRPANDTRDPSFNSSLHSKMISSSKKDSLPKENNFLNSSRPIFIAYPNPTTGKIIIEVDLNSEKQAEIYIEDILGNNIKKLLTGNVKKSKIEIDLNAWNLRPAVYNLYLVTKDEKINQKIVFIE